MNEEPRTQEPPQGKQNPTPGLARHPRLRVPIGLIFAYWALYFFVGGLEKPYFYGFIYGMASSLLFVLSFLGWWSFNRAIRVAEKLGGIGLLVLGCWIVGKYSHRSINILTIGTVGIPLVVTMIVAWMFLTGRKLISANRIGFVAVVAVTWSCLLFVRTDGLDSSLKSHVRWRWTPTSEELFLAQKQSNSRTPSVTSPAAAPSAPQAHSNDSPAFRGIQRDGVIHGTKVTTDWKDAPPKQLWKHAVGPAWSSVIVVGDRLYTQEQRGPMEAVVCYDSGTGNELWSHEDATRFDEGVSGPGPRATPSFADGRILALGGTGILNCLDAATGKVHWSRDIKNDAQSKPPLWGFSSSPLIVDQKVIVYGGGEAGKGLLAYRVESGELAWTADLGQSSYSSPQMTTIDGVAQCLMLHDGGLTGVDPATGKKLWETGLVMRGAPRCGQPHLVGESRVAVAILDGPGISLVDVSKKGDAWNVSPVWASKDLKPEFPDFVVHDGKAFGFDVSIFCCLDLATGKRVWKEGRFGRGQVILLEDQALLLVISEGGDAILLNADGKEEKELGRFHALNGKTWNDPTIANGRLYVRNAEEMACYVIQPERQTANR